MATLRIVSGVLGIAARHSLGLQHLLLRLYTALTTLENMEISGNLLILENSENWKYTQGILVYQMLFLS